MAASRVSSPIEFLFQSLSASSEFLNFRDSDGVSSNHETLDSKEGNFVWSKASERFNGGSLGILGDKGPVWTVVLLGWLGAEQKHLRRYAELYNSMGIHAVKFVVPVKDVMLGFDFGRGVERRVLGLAEELVSWVSESERDGRERCLIFHTFSNTGWFAYVVHLYTLHCYGLILDYLQGRGDYMSKIKGCVIDSGGCPEINPKVWAAGFSAALLKKRSSSTLPAVDDKGNDSQMHANRSKVHYSEPNLVEASLLAVLENLFFFILKWPDVNRRLTKIITIMSKNQPTCPQLYLYSTADKVIPFGSVEMFIEDQKNKGIKVRAYNFGSSPHVDHYRTFPDIYIAELCKFLKECITTVGKK
ncbi:hypothetical protein Sjap_010336 [Stephania japonica]|uniref:Transmembrane protein 53 n=1 Tax=Stephania japonica TaxID=461633 RepID=A0AAP0P4I2_9MAGN